MKTLFVFILVLSFANAFAEDQVSTKGTICADRSSGKTEAVLNSSTESEETKDNSSSVRN